MALPHVLLVDRSAPLVAAWAEAFDGIEGVSVHRGDFFGFASIHATHRAMRTA